MWIFKPFIISALAWLLMMTSVNASVSTGTIKDNNLNMSYPIVYIDNNMNAQDKINSDIANSVYKFRGEYSRGEFYSGKYAYKVKYEDDKYISIMFIEMRYMYGAAHTWDNNYCNTYDKTTGEKLSLPYFVKIASDDLDLILSLPVYDENNKLIPYNQTNINAYRKSNHARISDNFYLLGNGEIALSYPPYALAPYSFGFTHFVIKADMIDYLNRKNP